MFAWQVGENLFHMYIKVTYPFHVRNGFSLLLFLLGECILTQNEGGMVCKKTASFILMLLIKESFSLTQPPVVVQVSPYVGFQVPPLHVPEPPP